MVFRWTESHEQDGETLFGASMHQQRPAILPWRSSLSDANGQFMRPFLFRRLLAAARTAARYASAQNRAGRPARTSTADIEPFNQFFVTRLIAPLDVVEELTALGDHLEQAAA
jgi:hypothetical protein